MIKWPRYSKALDMRLGGATIGEIAKRFGVTEQRASQMVHQGGRQLAFRVFRGVPRPRPKQQIVDPPSERDWLIV